MNRVMLLLFAFAGSACFAPGRLTDEMPEDFPAMGCEDTDTDACVSSSGSGGAGGSTGGQSSATAPAADDCEASQTCLGEDSCVADWDAEAGSRGPYTCRFACVALLDEASWCRDDAACCDASARCTARGYCVLSDSTNSDGASSGSGSTGSGSTGTE
ncbi:MAG: hypothetical protein ACRBN8_20880 [Nannocystales bacterium]